MIPQHIKDTIMSEDTCNRLMNEFVHVIKSEIRRSEDLYDAMDLTTFYKIDG